MERQVMEALKDPIKKCPSCGSEVKGWLDNCSYCNYWFDKTAMLDDRGTLQGTTVCFLRGHIQGSTITTRKGWTFKECSVCGMAYGGKSNK